MTVSNDPPLHTNDLPTSAQWPDSESSTAAGSDSSGGLSDTKDTAQNEAQKVKDTAAGEAQQVASTVKEQTQAVTSDVRDQARQLVDQSRGQLSEQASSQKERAVSTLRSFGEELSGMAENAPSSGIGQQLTRQGGELTHKAADFLEQREPAQLLEEVRNLARQRPGTFLIGAAVAGLVAGRLSRGLQSSRSSDNGSSSSIGSAEPAYTATGSPTGYPVTNPTVPVAGVPATGEGYDVVHADPYSGDVVGTPAGIQTSQSDYPTSDPTTGTGGAR